VGCEGGGVYEGDSGEGGVVTVHECPKGHGPMERRPLKGQTPEQLWCGTWYDCQHIDKYGGPYGKCPCTLLVPSEELRQIYEKAGVTP